MVRTEGEVSTGETARGVEVLLMLVFILRLLQRTTLNLLLRDAVFRTRMGRLKGRCHEAANICQRKVLQ